MKPEGLKTQIFLDSGDPKETKEMLDLLGFLDGQTTNPSLFAKSPEVQEKISKGEKYTKEEIYAEYKKIIQDISALIPGKSVSVEVYADANTSAEEMLKQAREMNTWIDSAHIKLPLTSEGLKAAETLVREGVDVNMTLIFNQSQAAGVYAATNGAKKGQVFLSPFIGRLDDIDLDGMSYIKNVLKMYRAGDGHVEVLAASARSYEHFLRCLQLESDLVTVPGKILREWAENNFELPSEDWQYEPGDLAPIPYEDMDLNKNYMQYNIQHDLTDKGIEKFVADWNNLLV
ncbi:MAG: transaldolase [Candidatus Magasanikbacteria bacterium]|jgi:transaldolase|nr:transaldolase [Candidatus Magasanikbacteria bacterium]MBT4314730.1 transaldolase [Candidatus Magasanikbacteria bacterium]MBT4547507.1 transaldolase [Candidatus Magasanikbacteria bacterium]MBT6819427.1 transaldolase [Candidatus Magasanikbacteria bacterium]